MESYAPDFYEIHKGGSRRSAQQIIPLILPLIRPKSVIDIGCGVGAWLSLFHELGIEDFFGVDGDWVKKEMLQIPHARFRSFDLTKPFRLERQFDLVVSVEVAEHLPAECAKTFVDSLIRLGPAVMFSAAIPHQGGNHHVNEQWPEYWVKLFEDQGYAVIDCIRSRIWHNDEVEWPYAQNLLLFARRDYIETRSCLKEELENTRLTQLSIVHPRKYLEMINWIERLQQFSRFRTMSARSSRDKTVSS
jgi:SAM-dependent methyltransferase